MTTSILMYPALKSQREHSRQHFLADTLDTVGAALSHHAHAVVFVPEELRCQYSSKRCENHRTNKKSGGLHKFCAVHREKANRNQMRLDHRRRVLKRLAQREQRGSQGTPSSSSSGSSHTEKSKGDSGEKGDDDCARVLCVEDNLEIDLMPLALHRENNPTSAAQFIDSKPLFDPQDLHILETLLFSDEDQIEGGAANVREAAPACHGRCCDHSSPANKSRKQQQPKKARRSAVVKRGGEQQLC